MSSTISTSRILLLTSHLRHPQWLGGQCVITNSEADNLARGSSLWRVVCSLPSFPLDANEQQTLQTAHIVPHWYTHLNDERRNEAVWFPRSSLRFLCFLPFVSPSLICFSFSFFPLSS